MGTPRMDDTSSIALTASAEVAVFEVDGKETVLHASDMSRVIEAKMEESQLPYDQAWLAVQEDFAASLSGRRILPGQARSDRQPALFPVGPADIVTGTVTLEEKGEQPAVAPPPRSAGPGFRLAGFMERLTDEMLPRKDRGRQSVMRALADGMPLDGAHPDAELLRVVQPEDPMLDQADPSRVATRSAAVQLNLKFPQSPLGTSVFPSDFCRTSLYHVASNNVPRRECKQELMGQLGNNISLLYEGTELRHDDERVLMQLIQLAQNRPPWAWVEISTLQFARTASGTKRKVLGQTDAESVEDSLQRMRRGLVTVVKDKHFVTINPIRELQGAGARRLIQLDPRIVLLFGSYVSFDDEMYHTTRGIERQLFKYLHTNQYEDIYPIKVRSLFELCYGTVEALQAAYLKDNPGKTEKDARRAILTKKVSDFRSKGLPAALEGLKSKRVVAKYTFDEDEDKVAIQKGPFFTDRQLAPELEQ